MDWGSFLVFVQSQDLSAIICVFQHVIAVPRESDANEQEAAEALLQVGDWGSQPDEWICFTRKAGRLTPVHWVSANRYH